jgi:hypothetical protein
MKTNQKGDKKPDSAMYQMTEPARREQRPVVKVRNLFSYVSNACENPSVKKGELHMQENLWGEYECIDLQRMPRRTPETMSYTPVHCELYGHTWEYFGITGLKRCSVCQMKGYCPGCTQHPPTKDAKPFYCTKHTSLQGESEGRA